MEKQNIFINKIPTEPKEATTLNRGKDQNSESLCMLLGFQSVNHDLTH